jgi:stage III sporulation protein AE
MKTAKIAACLLIFLGTVFFIPNYALADEQKDAAETKEILSSQFESLNSEDIERFISQLNHDNDGYLPQLSWRDLVWDNIEGKFDWNLFSVIKRGANILFREVTANFHIMGKLILLAVICAILQNFQGAFSRSSVSEIAYAVCFLLLVTISLGGFIIAVDLGKQVVTGMVNFMQAILPMLIALLVGMGGVTTAAVFSPVILGSVEFIGTVIHNFLIPLIFFTAILSVVSNVTDKISISKLTSFLKEVSVVVLSLLMCLFLGIMSIQGVTASITDGVSLRTLKYLTGAFVPIVGGMFSDALEVVAGCSLILKNAVGIGGIIILFIVLAVPLLKMAALVLIYRFSSVIIQPIGDKRIVDALNSMGNSLILLFVSVASVGFMFIVAITIIIGAGNMAVMLR